MLIDPGIAIRYFLSIKITAESAESAEGRGEEKLCALRVLCG